MLPGLDLLFDKLKHVEFVFVDRGFAFQAGQNEKVVHERLQKR